METATVTRGWKRMKKDGRAKPEINWREVNLKLLESLWNSGMTATQCAGEMPGTTRNSIISAVHRHQGKQFGDHTIRFEERSSGQASPAAKAAAWSNVLTDDALVRRVNKARLKALKAKQAPKSNKATAPDQEIALDELFTAPTKTMKTFFELGDRDCNWPLGDLYCGDTVEGRTRYCKTHLFYSQRHSSHKIS